MAQDRRDKLVLSAAAGALPLSVLINVRELLQLDSLHLVLLELLLLLLAKIFLFASPPSAIGNRIQAQPAHVRIQEINERDEEETDEQPTSKIPADAASAGPKIEEPSSADLQESKLYPRPLVDRLLWHFVSFIDPLALPLLPPSAADPAIPACQLKQWNITYTLDALVVRQHPDEPALYASTNYFPTVELRAIYEMLVNLEVRSSWDSLTERAEPLERLPYARGGADYLALRSLFPIKAKDLVLLSAYATLPPTRDGRKRLISAARSVEHPTKPPGTPGYARMNIKISGFLLEEHPDGGTSFTQIADLSSLGSWIPAKIVNFITTNALPRGMRKVALAAETTDWPAHRKLLKGDDWMPPVLGVGHEDSSPSPSKAKAKSSAGDKEDAPAPLPSEARLLSTQLSAITDRLASLESEVKAQSHSEERRMERRGQQADKAAASSWWWWPFSYVWPSTEPEAAAGNEKSDVRVQRRVNRRRTDVQLAVLKQVVVSVGGMASIAALAAWVMRRRR